VFEAAEDPQTDAMDRVANRHIREERNKKGDERNAA
jgi:hypothetical protein